MSKMIKVRFEGTVLEIEASTVGNIKTKLSKIYEIPFYNISIYYNYKSVNDEDSIDLFKDTSMISIKKTDKKLKPYQIINLDIELAIKEVLKNGNEWSQFHHDIIIEGIKDNQCDICFAIVDRFEASLKYCKSGSPENSAFFDMLGIEKCLESNNSKLSNDLIHHFGLERIEEVIDLEKNITSIVFDCIVEIETPDEINVEDMIKFKYTEEGFHSLCLYIKRNVKPLKKWSYKGRTLLFWASTTKNVSYLVDTEKVDPYKKDKKGNTFVYKNDVLLPRNLLQENEIFHNMQDGNPNWLHAISECTPMGAIILICNQDKDGVKEACQKMLKSRNLSSVASYKVDDVPFLHAVFNRWNNKNYKEFPMELTAALRKKNVDIDNKYKNKLFFEMKKCTLNDIKELVNIIPCHELARCAIERRFDEKILLSIGRANRSCIGYFLSMVKTGKIRKELSNMM